MAAVSGRYADLVRTPLQRYRTMSYVAGTALTILVFVGVPLQVWANVPGLAAAVGVVHGVVLFPVYLLTIIQLAFTVRLRLWWWALIILGGIIPGLAFVMEHYVTKELAGRAAAAGEVAGEPAAT